ncbi:MAG: nucleotide exchange factor GrpE [Acidithiobacillus sp.]|nr:nucleotide exchange factor GrpE [Acidithiobacillus sp.]
MSEVEEKSSSPKETNGENAVLPETDWQAEAERLKGDYLRALADMDNLRKRTEKQIEDARNYAVERFARELLPVVDSLELALASPLSGDDAVSQLRQGLENTLELFFAALQKAGVRAVEIEEGRFDPHLHQAIAMVESDGEPNRVLTVHQKGYRIHERLLRPSMVSVSKAAKSE